MALFALVVVLFLIIAGLVLSGSVHRWPARWALLLAAIVVGLGAVATVIDVVDGVTDSRVSFRGTLDEQEILRQFHASGRDEVVEPPSDRGYLSAGWGEMTVPDPSTIALVAWALGQLLPWALAVFALVRVAPILRASERGEPFDWVHTRRLWTLGGVLLIGIPVVACIQYAAAELATNAWIAPTVEPALMLTPLQLLPGALVLVLAGLFQRGAELRDFERETV